MENGGDAACFVGNDCEDIWQTAERVKANRSRVDWTKVKSPIVAKCG